MKLKNMSLKSKLISAFIVLIVFPLIILGIFSSYLYSQEIQNTVVKSAVQSSQQIIKNLDSFLGMMAKLSEYPLKDEKIRSVLTKDYSLEEHPEYERSRDFDTVRDLLYKNIGTYSNLIDYIYLYQAKTYEIRGRTPTDSLNINFKPSGEKWLNDISRLEGGYAIIGVHKDTQTLPRGDYVISVGRSVIEPGTNNNLGVIVINIKTGELEKLWSDSKLTPNSIFYLVDESDSIIFSRDKNQVSMNIDQILDRRVNYENSINKPVYLNNEKYYLITSVSKFSKWKTITLIPGRELFSYIDKMFVITLLTIFIITALSVIVAVLIATGVTRPLYKLNGKMRQVANGNFDIEIGTSYGEVGEIGRTVQKMIMEIKTLISKIYKEEEEKRNAEMNALQSQINPHFLYNTLNTIKWMANIQGASSIENALNSLSSLFAFTAKSSGDFVPITDEIKFIQDYLKILNLRYYNKFVVSFEIDEEIYKYKTLKFLLQPVIENAVFHGMESTDRKGLLKVAAYCRDNKIIFEVEDNGKGISDEVLENIFKEENEAARSKFNSIGIPNIQKRIKLHFGGQYGLSIQSIDNQGTTVKIEIPAIALEN